MTTDELLNSFLERWQPDDIQKMTLEEYVGVGNKDTFCQWVETKTRGLGSIKGWASIKFGIYERKDPDKRPINYRNGERYSWLRTYGDNSNEAFQNVKKDIINIVDYSQKGRFDLIDEITLPDLFKWKVAFLFSNERLIPIYKRTVLIKIANHFGLKSGRDLRVSEIQSIMTSHKPAYQDVYEYMWELFGRFGEKEENDSSLTKTRPRRRREGSKSRNTLKQFRAGTSSYIAEQKHNKIQELLHKQLVEKYGEANVILEENFVDVKLIQPDYLGFYEVKSASYASQCVKEALGQVLLYVHFDGDQRKKKIYVVGQYPATEQDKLFIEYIKDILRIDFDYFNVSI